MPEKKTQRRIGFAITDRASENERVGQRIGPLARRRSFLVHVRASGFSYRCRSIVIKLPVTLYRIADPGSRGEGEGGDGIDRSFYKRGE